MTAQTARAGAAALLLAVLPTVARGQAAAAAEQYILRAEGRYWSPKPLGEIQVGFGDDLGTPVDIETVLGVEGSTSFAASGSLRIKGGVKLRGSYTPIDFQGDRQITETFRFGEDTFTYGERVVTRVKGAYYQAALEIDFLRKPSSHVGFIIGANVVDGDFVLVSRDVEGRRRTESGTLPIPVLGLTARTYTGKVSSETTFTGITAGSKGYTYDFELGLRLHLTNKIAVGGTYRKIKVKGENDRDAIRFEMSGWTAALELSL